MLGAVLGFFGFLGHFPSVSPSVLGVLLGFLRFLDHFPSVSPSVLGAVLGFSEEDMLIFCKLCQKLCKAFQKSVFEIVLVYLHIKERSGMQ